MSEVIERKMLNKLPPTEKCNCFGCSSKNAAGLHMEFYTNHEMDLVVSWLSIPKQFCSVHSNITHGGIISTIVDEAMGYGALVILKKLILSKSITVDFLSPVLLEKEIRVEATVKEKKSDREAMMEARIYNKNGEICARASSVVILFEMEDIKKMGIMDEEFLKDIEELMNSYEG